MRVIVLLGGDSAEREVSHVSGRAVAAALKKCGHDVLAIDTLGGQRIDFDGSAEIHEAPPGEALITTGHSIQTVEKIHERAFGDVDVVFLALHGTGGEDGTIQGLLESIHLPYTGSGVLASSLAMDKEMSKRVFRDAGVPTPAGFAAPVSDDLDSLQKKIERICGLPFVVKPNSQGSSVGVSILSSMDGLAEAVRLTAEYDDRAIFETFVPGRELTVAILADRALPVVEIVTHQGFYDYRSKYTPGNTQYVVPADLPQAVAQRMQESAKLAFDSLRCRDFARVDFRLTPDNEFYCLEVNTIPGMTSASLVPKAAKAAGIGFEELVESITKMAAARDRVRSSH